LGFFSYHGAKLLLLPIIIVSVFYLSIREDKSKIDKKESGYLVLATALLVIGFYVICQFIPGSIFSNRVGEFFFMDKGEITTAVNDQRKLSVTTPLQSLFVNKSTVIVSIFLKKYLGAFCSEVLWVSGDSRLIYTFYQHGLLYIIDIFFLGIGFAVLFSRYPREFLFLISLILIAPLASGLSGVTTSYVHRSFLLSPLLRIVIGVGVYESYLFFGKRLRPNIVMGALFLLYAVSFLNFCYFYFFRYSIIAGELYALSERLSAKFVSLSMKENKSIVVVGTNAPDRYLEYLFYANNQKAIEEHIVHMADFNSGRLKIGNVQFVGGCPEKFDSKTIYVVSTITKCFPKERPYFSINDPKDAGALFVVYNSTVCQGIAIASWNRYHLRSDFTIEKMNTKQFCERWVAPI
jgi:hypothetical protein